MSSRTNNDQCRLGAAISRDGGVLFDVEHDRLLKLNPVAAEMWRLLSEENDESEVVDRIAEQYCVDKQRVTNDLRALLARIAALGVRIDRSKLVHPEHASAESVLNSTNSPAQPSTTEQPNPSAWLVLCSLLGLAIFDLTLWATSLKSLCEIVQVWRLRANVSKERWNVIAEVCRAVEQACVWYPKKAPCLQRSAVATCMLRNRGVPARLVVGARPMPFLAHAWVEVENSVVNDLQGVKNFYQPLASY